MRSQLLERVSFEKPRHTWNETLRDLCAGAIQPLSLLWQWIINLDIHTSTKSISCLWSIHVQQGRVRIFKRHLYCKTLTARVHLEMECLEQNLLEDKIDAVLTYVILKQLKSLGSEPKGSSSSIETYSEQKGEEQSNVLA